MKKLFFIFSAAVLLGEVEASFSQPTTAIDFTMNDCATGQIHNLYSILDSGNAVIMEFFMDNCSPCVDAGKALDSMYKNLRLTCPNIRFFQTAFNNTYDCITVNKWVSTNGFFSSVPFDSGAAQISYYGFFGMPTVAVAAGNTHKLIYLLTSGGFSDSDTSVIADSIRNFCGMSSVTNYETNEYSISISPNPSPNGKFKVESSKFKIEKAEVFDITGRLIKTSNLELGILNLGDAGKGIYLLKATVNNKFFAQKILVQ